MTAPTATSHDLISLLDDMRSTAAATVEDAFNRLNQRIGSGIKLRYEVLKQAEAAPAGSRSFAKLNGATIGRVMLSVDRSKADFGRELVQQCCGLVMDYDNWRVLAVQSPTFPLTYKFSEVAPKIQHYKIYEISDGTIVTLYWHNRWCIASANGFDVSGYRWIGEKTYQQALSELLGQVPGFDLDALDRDYCYTIGFRHHSFHPLKEDPERVWFVQKVNVAKLNQPQPELDVQYEHTGLPGQKLVDLAQLQAPRGRSKLYALTARCDGAMAQFVSSKGRSINYGYVLRGPFDKLGRCANIILESTLLRKVRQIMYNMPKPGRSAVVPATPEHRLQYIVLRAYLSNASRYDILTLFPHLKPMYDGFDSIFKELVSRLVTALRCKQQVAPSADAIGTLMTAFLRHIESKLQISPFDPMCSDIVMDFVRDYMYLDLYYKCLVDDSA